MKKRWTIFVAILIVIGVAALATYDNNKRQDEATMNIINDASKVDQIKITKKGHSLTLKGEDAKPFVEQTPLVKVEKFERPLRKLFDKEATFTIQYFVKGKELYSVSLLNMQEKPQTSDLDDFLINEHLLVKWTDYQMLLSQHDKIQALVEKFNTK